MGRHRGGGAVTVAQGAQGAMLAHVRSCPSVFKRLV